MNDIPNINRIRTAIDRLERLNQSPEPSTDEEKRKREGLRIACIYKIQIEANELAGSFETVPFVEEVE